MASNYVQNTNFKAGVDFEDKPKVYKPYAYLNDHLYFFRFSNFFNYLRWICGYIFFCS